MAPLQTVSIAQLPEMRLFVLEVDESLVATLNTTLLPPGWNGTAPLLSQTLLNEWLDGPDALSYN